MVARYHNKQEKFQVAKWQSADEQKPVWEMERVMDVQLFLGIQDNWAEDSPHHLVVLYEMFRHAAIEGWKEAERIIHWGRQQNMPQLNPEAGVPTIQLVGLETTKEELLEIYLEVYKLHRLPGSLLESWQSSKRWWPLSQTAQDAKRKRPPWPQCSLILGAPISPGVVPPTGEETTTLWIEVLLQFARPTKRCWPQGLLWRKRLRD